MYHSVSQHSVSIQRNLSDASASLLLHRNIGELLRASIRQPATFVFENPATKEEERDGQQLLGEVVSEC